MNKITEDNFDWELDRLRYNVMNGKITCKEYNAAYEKLCADLENTYKK